MANEQELQKELHLLLIQSVQELIQRTSNLIEDVLDDGSWEKKTSFVAKKILNFQRNRLAQKTFEIEKDG